LIDAACAPKPGAIRAFFSSAACPLIGAKKYFRQYGILSPGSTYTTVSNNNKEIAVVPIRITLSLFAAALFLSACTSMTPPMVKKSDGIMVSESGMTLYTFDKDVAGSGRSACSGPCAAAWPAAAASYPAPYSVVTREDGSKQLAWHGKPLYLYAQDTRPGERKGDNFKSVWHVVAD
jgi:predicted lipoprotein with Yx(FWY)xxD motif